MYLIHHVTSYVYVLICLFLQVFIFKSKIIYIFLPNDWPVHTNAIFKKNSNRA